MSARSTRKQAAQQAIQAAGADLRALSLDIHSHPELNFQEVHAHAALTDFLEERGFEVARGAWGLPTAFKATIGSGSPTVAVLCEYDALPGIGHACGHNLIAIAGVATGLGAQAALRPGEGTLLVLGSPAEEGGGGKQFMIERGAFNGVDAALMLHPAPIDQPWGTALAIQQLEVEYHGRGAHASASPHDGINALDALVLAYNNLSALRQQFRSGQQVHGVFHEAGVKANIIPHHTRAEYILRARNFTDLEDLKRRALACFQGAATATGCRLEHQWAGPPYDNVLSNEPLGEAFVENARALGWPLPHKNEAPQTMGGSTDMGNVSHVVPGIHPLYAIPSEAGNHTEGFTAAAATPEAHERTLRAATALAMTVIDAFLDPDLLPAAKAAFAAGQQEPEPARPV
jgi:amidohydrolase